MAHYAQVVDGIVQSVLVVPDEHEDDGNEYLSGLGLGDGWLQTSYNTRGNVHYGPEGEPDGGVPLRYNYAGIGFTYDEVRDGFVPPEPDPVEGGAWVLDDATLTWVFVPDEVE
ncbi:MAG TPA: hypothetical protein VIG24_15135 [Acidimicrobiia bacterium]